MKKLVVVGTALLAVLTLGPREAAAASFTVDFCPEDGTCPAGVDTASLTFTENLGTADVNDYTVVAQFDTDGTEAADLMLKAIDITIGGAQGDIEANGGDYESIPVLTATTTDFANWSAVDWGKIPGCADPGGDNSFCTENTTGVDLSTTPYTLTFTVDLADAFGALESGDSVNLRAQFLPHGNLSPDGGPLGGSVGGGEGGLVGGTIGGGAGGLAPEPTLLTMLGAGLALAGRRLRRKASK
jgi:hypothetical protein